MKNLIRKILNESLSNGFNDLTNEDLYEISKWGLEGEYEYSGCKDDYEDLESSILCGVEDFKNFLSKPYPVELGNFPNNPIIYRIVKLKDIDDLDKINLGHSWFSNPNQYKEDCFFDMLEYIKPGRNNPNIFLLKGRTNVNNVDIRRTLWERSTQWCENEIVIIDDSKIELLSIEKITF